MGNNFLSVWGTIGSVALAILILLVMITVHEFGHWAAGRLLKFKIDEFSIGFGPAFFKLKGKKTGQIFAVRLIPLGGYCAFAGEDGLEEETKEAPAEPFAEISQERKEENGTGEGQERKEEVAEPPHSPPTPPVDKSGYFTHKKPWQRIIVLLAGAFMNYVLALFLIITLFAAYGQTMVVVRGVAEGTAEQSEYSLREGDILLAAGGRNLYLSTDIARAVNGRQEGDLVSFTVSRVQEDGTRRREKITVMMRGAVTVKNSTDFSGVWKALGIGVEEREDGSYYMLGNEAYRFGFFETIGRSFAYSFRIAGSIFRVLGELLTGKLSISALGGPVTTISMTSQIAAQGFASFLEIASYIGVNLAVFNLLPIPALDGSKIVFTAIEWVRGKPISRKVEAIIHAVGFVLLLGFAVLVDILQFI